MPPSRTAPGGPSSRTPRPTPRTTARPALRSTPTPGTTARPAARATARPAARAATRPAPTGIAATAEQRARGQVQARAQARGQAQARGRDAARARAQQRARAARRTAQRRADRRSARVERWARRRAAAGVWAARSAAVTAALTLVLVAAVVLSGARIGVPAAASVPLDLTAQATALRTAQTDTATRLRTAQDAVAAAAVAVGTAESAQQQAATELAAARAAVGTDAADLYRRAPGASPALAGLAGGDPGTAVTLQVAADDAAQESQARVARAEVTARAAAVADARLATARAGLATARRGVEQVLTTARARSAATGTEVTRALAGLVTAPTSAEQQAVDATARARWQASLAALGAAGITPPPAAAIAAGDLPEGLVEVRDAAGRTVPGVVSGVVDGAVVTVPSAEAVAAVSAALAALGTPYVPGATGSGGVDCTGLTAAVWTGAGIPVGASLAEQWSAGTVVPADQLQPGDLVFGTGPLADLDDVGVYVGDGAVVTASATTRQVVVQPAEAGAAAVRVTVPAAAPNSLPGTGAPVTACGAVPVTAGSAPVDPSWGGWSNGRIPSSALCAVADGQRLRCDAATAYTELATAFRQAFGTQLCISDSYRSLDAQVDAHVRKPRITAVPGTSTHGWALAVDLCGGVNVAGTPQSVWMERYAGLFGWVHPDWAQQGGSNPEPWHWEFGVLQA